MQHLCLDYDRDFFAQYEYLASQSKQHILLESGPTARFSIAGLAPVASLVGKGSASILTTSDGIETYKGNPMHQLKAYMQKNYVPTTIKDIPFTGGAIGYLSYDYVRYLEKLPAIANDDLQIPDAAFLIFDDVAVYDREKRQLWLMTHQVEALQTLEAMKALWTKEIIPTNYPKTAAPTPREYSFDGGAFDTAVHAIKEYIAAGDVFQVNLSTRQAEAQNAHPMDIYKQLRALNPSPYMSYLSMGNMEIASCSPELLVKKEGQHLSTRPIAGTRSRGKNDAEDQALVDELVNDEKERAEHVMLVDLERNDLGRVSKYGTVEVDELMAVEKYSHVMHIVSNVKSQIAEDKDVYHVIDAMFPGGTITGAPKIRTMEIIEELEPVRRGIYTGSIGWIGYNEDAELNIAIRTMVAKGGKCYVQAGAGVVIDSIGPREYKESLKKARALWQAKELADEREAINP